eukprot:scaffold83747_cov15-Tisochrysis_lutea.AAC.3
MVQLKQGAKRDSVAIHVCICSAKVLVVSFKSQGLTNKTFLLNPPLILDTHHLPKGGSRCSLAVIRPM